MASTPKRANSYKAIIGEIFKSHYVAGATSMPFDRHEISDVANRLGVTLPKNVGDPVYSVRYRIDMPDNVLAASPVGMEWTIRGRGKSKYAFVLGPRISMAPTQSLYEIKIPSATPEIILAHSLSDEQALLARVRYNRLIDIFLGVTAYSLQNHLRTSVRGLGQIEIDELYVAVDSRGEQFIIPVQAKGGSDKLSAVQTQQDMDYCKLKFSDLTCRAVAAQFLTGEKIVLFELVEQGGLVKIKSEKHYLLVPADRIGPDDLKLYAQAGP